MKVISLYQPFASACFASPPGLPVLKQYETRHWDTRYRGLLLIHATKSMPAWCKEWVRTESIRRLLKDKGIYHDNMPMGAIVGQVELIRTLRTEDWLDEKHADVLHHGRWHEEYIFGDYSENRFAWEFKNPIRFREPITATGAQGFWNFDLQSAINSHL